MTTNVSPSSMAVFFRVCSCRFHSVTTDCRPWLGGSCECWGEFGDQAEAGESGVLDSPGGRPQGLAEGSVHHPARQWRSRDWSSAAVTTAVSGERTEVSLRALHNWTAYTYTVWMWIHVLTVSTSLIMFNFVPFAVDIFSQTLHQSVWNPELQI